MNKKPIEYMQTDPRWKGLPYRVPGESATIGGSGCGPTCAAMLIETLTGKTFTPPMACEWSKEHGYKALNQGTYYSYFVPQFKAFGIECMRLNTTNVYGKPNAGVHEEALALLRMGYYIIACMGKGLWTSSGHYIVVWNAQERYVSINDPASRRTDRLCGDMATFRNQVKYYWAIDAREYNKEDEDMSYDKFKEYMKQYEAEKAEETASEWAKAGLAQAMAKGITDGKRPQSWATRQEVALMVNKAK